MLNLQNHAIPMLSLTYSKKKDAHGRHSDSSPPEFPVSGAPQVGKRVSSDDELARSSDLTRRLSSSAPPISLPGSIDRKSYMDENNNRSRDYNSVPKRVER
uniref:Uncharacterized protein n=1 Tax=Ciona savignyi TaxID=51511 RepID=H2ZJ09_CIOSA